MVQDSMQRRKTAVALLSVMSNVTLVVGKITVGLAIGSVSVISEAIHSGMDLLAAGIALYAVKTAGKPADEGHPFGHGKVENISGTVEAVLILAAAGWIVYEAVHRLLHPGPLESTGWGVAVMGGSAVVNALVSHCLFKVGRETDSPALQADAWHLRTDVYTSAGVMGGLALIWLAETVFPGHHFHWIDPAAAIAVALLIAKTAWSLTLEAGRDLLDTRLPLEEEALIREHIAAYIPTVRGFHRLRTRKSGAHRFIEFHLIVDAQMTVENAHSIAHAVTASIKEHYPDTTATVHVEPCRGDCLPHCTGDCLLTPAQRDQVRAEAQTPCA